jgi:uncharacterized integral membrane protein
LAVAHYFKPKILNHRAITEMRRLCRTPRILMLVFVISISALLFNTYRLYKGTYFWLDDFNNLYWVQQASFSRMMGYILNPVSSYFRPAGMMCYWTLLRFFDLNPSAYHGLAWSLHAVNTALIYVALKRFTQSRFGAAVGAMLFASQPLFANIYWNFGTIFELVAAFFSLLGIILWTVERRGWSHVIFASVALLLAMKGKEIAVAIPIIWITYDLLVRKEMNLRIVAQWLLPSALALWYGLARGGMRGTLSSDPYYMDISAATLVSGFGMYFNMLLGTKLQWQIWCVGFVLLLLVFVLLRNRLAVFFQFYVFIAFLPLIFLVNHRFAFYWYLPFFGVSGLAAILAKAVAVRIEARNPHWLVRCGASAIFILLCWGSFVIHDGATRQKRSRARDRTNEYRAFVTGLRALPTPPPGEVIFFDSRPSLFDENLLQNATQVALGRTDIKAKFVAEFPPEARYRLQFHESRLIRILQ